MLIGSRARSVMDPVKNGCRPGKICHMLVDALAVLTMFGIVVCGCSATREGQTFEQEERKMSWLKRSSVWIAVPVWDSKKKNFRAKLVDRQREITEP